MTDDKGLKTKTKIDVDHVAKLANLPLSSEEKKIYEEQLSETLDYVHKLDEVGTEGLEPTSQVTGLENVLREDTAENSLSQDDVLQNTKSKHNGFFKVKAILEEE